MRIIVFLIVLLTCLAPVRTGEEDSPVVARLRVLLGRISRLSAMQQDEGRLFCTDEYRDLAQFCQKNIAEVADDWEAACRIPVRVAKPRLCCRFDKAEDLLILSLCSVPSQFSDSTRTWIRNDVSTG